MDLSAYLNLVLCGGLEVQDLELAQDAVVLLLKFRVPWRLGLARPGFMVHLPFCRALQGFSMPA